MRINYNATAMRTVNSLNTNDSELSKATQKLSSGYKINSAKDNPAGYALSRKMRAQIEALKQAGDNSADGVNIIESTDGALAEIQDMTQRLNELAIKASNGILSDADREAVQNEVVQLKDEIQRVSDTTEFNGQKLLDGSFDLKGYTSNISVKVISYTDSVDAGTYSFSLGGLNFTDGNITTALADITLTPKTEGGTDISNLPDEATISAVDGNIITITGNKGFSLSVTVAPEYTNDDMFSVAVTGLGAMTLQVGANEGQTLDVRIPNVGIKSLGMESLEVTTKESATKAIDLASQALAKISSIRSRLGAYQNRLESTGDTIDVTEENLTSALSTITDVDMSEEYTNYSTFQILSQASTSVLAQANERPSQVLQLLQ